MSWGGGVQNLTARNSSDNLGTKIDMKRVPVRALKLRPHQNAQFFQGEAIQDHGRSPNIIFWVETAGFQVDVFERLFGMPLTNERKTYHDISIGNHQ